MHSASEDLMDMRIRTFAAEHHHSEGESLDRVEFDPTGMQDATRSRLHGRIVLSVEQLNEVVNPAATEGAAQQSECHQTNGVKTRLGVTAKLGQI